jgi:hypothetical protein
MSPLFEGFFMVIPKHLEQEIRNNLDGYMRAACVNTVPWNSLEV